MFARFLARGPLAKGLQPRRLARRRRALALEAVAAADATIARTSRLFIDNQYVEARGILIFCYFVYILLIFC